jgi:hypothetical protein
MTVDDLRSIFSRWKAEELAAAGVTFKESFDPLFDPRCDDYRLIYAATFEPATLDQARMEFAVTDTGHVAVGIETKDRILARTGLAAIIGRFAAGHEPVTATKEGLQTLFDAVTKGRMFIVVWSLLRIATLVRVYLCESDCDAMARSGYRYYGISAIPDENTRGPPVRLGTILSYRPW